MNPQPGYKHILYIAEVNDDTLPQLYEKFLPDIVALEIDSVREKIWWVKRVFYLKFNGLFQYKDHPSKKRNEMKSVF